MKKIQIFTILLILAITTGCGFHLRGAIALPRYLQSIYITPDDPYEPLQKSLRRILLRNHVQIATEVSTNTAVLELTTPNYSENVQAFNSNGQPERFKLTINFQYQVYFNNKILRPLTIIQYSREFTLQPNQLLSSDNERSVIKEELLREAVSQLLRQLSTIPAPN